VLKDPRVSGVIFFARNFVDPQQIMDLVKSIRELRSDLILSVDQEGGRVQRFQTGMTRLPSFAKLAEAGTEACRDLGWLMAREILELGIDLSYTPVLDINYGRNTVIAERSFGADAPTVVRFATAYMQGLAKAGMPATGKHFPGHGWVELDSHIALPIDERPLEQIQSDDYDVFLQVNNSLAAVMTAHVLYQAVDSCIATYSSKWMKLLRQDVNFKGVIISDDLAMAGATGVGCVKTRAQAAIDAGCDLLLMCNNRDAVLELLESDGQWYSETSIEGLRGRVGDGFASLAQQEEYQLIQERWKALLH
jgi:beta-N-acetylhexosaminidase